MEVFFAIGLAQGVFLMLILLSKKENKVPNRLLAFLIFLISFSLFLNYCYTTGLIRHIPHLIGLDNPNPFLIPPIIFFYAKALTSKEFRLTGKEALHFLPFTAYFVYVFFSFFLQDAAYKIEFLDRLRNVGMPPDLLASSFLKVVQAIAYLLTTYRALGVHAHSIEEEFSYTEKINLSWLKAITLSIAVIYGIRLVGIVLPLLFSQFSPGFIEGIMELVNVVFIYLMAYFGLTQPEIFKKWKTNSSITAEASSTAQRPVVEPKTKYAASVLTADNSKEILQALLDYMAKEKPYLTSGLTIKDVADALAVHPRYLSQVINEQRQLNFFNFVNEYRVAEVKSKLKDENFAHYSILSIALDSGFSSKSSFNSIFKKSTGVTPTAYKSTLS